jgi:hypothetical protein
MEIQQVTSFNFSFNHKGIGFNFNIPAQDRGEAMRKLLEAFLTFTEELKSATKTGPN